MSTDSTELTFVRCPSCRSLVPAVSSRCRMCGAALEALAKPAEPPAAKEMRQPQATVVSKQAHLDDFEDDFSDEDQNTQSVENEFDASHNEPPIDDPLSAYIEEVDIFESAGQPEEVEETVQASSDVDESEPASVARSKAPAPANTSEDVEFEVAPRKSTGIQTNKNGHANGNQEQSHENQQKEKKSEQVSPQSFATTQKAAKTERSEPQSPKPQAEKLQPQSSASKSKPETKTLQAQEKSEFADKPSATPARAVGDSVDRAQTESKVTKQASPGRLCGWLVSYVNPEGTAIELRESKFFISSARIKPHDLVLQDESISAPHAMLAVSANSGLVVQDLMSEQGVFVKRRGATEYEQEDEAFSLQNGDWLRFGVLEFCVVLMPD